MRLKIKFYNDLSDGRYWICLYGYINGIKDIYYKPSF